MAEHTYTGSTAIHKHTHTQTHIPPNYPGQWLPAGEANCLFPLPRADTEPSGCALKIDQLCVPVLSPLATAYLHKSLFWECHPARVKRGERLIWRSSELCRAVRPVSVFGSIIVIYAQPSVTSERQRERKRDRKREGGRASPCTTSLADIFCL